MRSLGAAGIVIVVIAAAVANAVKDLLTGVLGGVSYGSLLANIASGFIVALGVIAALNQVGIGLSVTMPVLIAVLATVGGIPVVGVDAPAASTIFSSVPPTTPPTAPPSGS